MLNQRRRSSSISINRDGLPYVTHFPVPSCGPILRSGSFFLTFIGALFVVGGLFNPAWAVLDNCERLSKVKSWLGTYSVQASGSGNVEAYSVVNEHSARGTVSFNTLDTPFSGCPQSKFVWKGAKNFSGTINDKATLSCDPGTVVITRKGQGKETTWGTQDGARLEFDVSSNLYFFSAIGALETTWTVTDCDGHTNSGSGPFPWSPFDYNDPTKEFSLVNQPIPSIDLDLTGVDVPIIAPGGELSIPMEWKSTWSFAPAEDTIPDPCKANGSVIGCENQSLGEDIEVVGTPFYLHYQSDRAAGRFLASSVAIMHTKQLGGWTLNLHHTYDPTLNTLYLGAGDKRDTVALATVKRSASGDFLIASEGGEEVYVFDATGRHQQTRDALTGAIRYQFGYDGQQRLVSVTDAYGNVTRIERDVSGNPTGILAPFGQHTSLAINVKGYLASVTDPAGHLIKLSTSPTGLLTGFINARNKTSNFAYDGDGHLVSDQDAVGAVQTLARTEGADNFIVTRTSGAGRTFGYDVTPHPAAGEDRVITDANGLKSTVTRDAKATETNATPDGMQSSQTVGPDPRFGRSGGFVKHSTLKTPSGLTRIGSATRTATLTNPADIFSLQTLNETSTLNGRTAKRTYDATNRIFTDISPSGRKLLTTLDAKGRVIKNQVPGIYPTIYAYDSHGRLASLSQGPATAPRTVLFEYGADGLLANVTNSLGQKTTLIRDLAGWVSQETLPDGRSVGYAYDANGNVTGITPPRQTHHTFAYSGVDLPIIYTAPPVGVEVNKTTYIYNLDRQLKRVNYPDGKTVLFGYDTAGRLSTTQIARGTLTQTYDNTTGNVKSLTAPGNIGLTYAYDGFLPIAVSWTGPVAGQVGYAYDNDFHLTTLRLNGNALASYKYDSDGLLIRAGGLTFARNADNGLLTGTTYGLIQDQWSYDGYGDPLDYATSFNGSPLYNVHYGRDKLGRIVSIQETIQGETNQHTYQYSVTGRLSKVIENSALKASYTYDANGNRLSVTRGAVTLKGTYDAQDRLTKYGNANYTYTANGELTSKNVDGQTTLYQYDALGNLTKVMLPNGTQIGYLIDGQNRRIGKQRNGTLVKSFLYQDQLKPIAELNGAGKIVSRFIYATHVNVPDLMIRGGVTYRIITDHLGSPRLVVNSSTGAAVQRIDYDEFGRVLKDTNPGFQPFGFAGGFYDPETRLVRFDARDYDAETGRWTAKDPEGFRGSSTNLYSYAFNDPVNWIDVNGRDPEQLEAGQPQQPSQPWDQRVRKCLDKLSKIPDWVLKGLSGPAAKLKKYYKKLTKMEKIAEDVQETVTDLKSPDPADTLNIIDRAMNYIPQAIPLTPARAVHETIEQIKGDKRAIDSYYDRASRTSNGECRSCDVR